jgi:UDP-glucose 4-epimerase
MACSIDYMLTHGFLGGVGMLVKNDAMLITGGAGFIGRALIQIALDCGCRIAVYDNLSFGKRSNLEAFGDRITFFEEDIRNEAAFSRACQDFNPNRIIHLAALHFIPYCNLNPGETLDVNVVGTHTILHVCAKLGIGNVVFASTGALYSGVAHPLRESEDIPAPVDVYGLSKLLGENVCAYFNATAGLNCRIARLFNAYGPYETNPHLIPHLLNSLKQGPRIELGNLHTKRDYVYVEDLANILFCYSNLEMPNETVMNIGTGREYSALEIVKHLDHLLGQSIEVISDPKRTRLQDKEHQIADTSRMLELTGCTPQYGLLDGLRKLLVHEKML